MGVKKVGEKYRCNVCGNEVTVTKVGGGELVCCEKPMEKQKVRRPLKNEQIDQGTKTEQNLLKAFAGESQARNRYTYFASAAKKEGLEQIANILQRTARKRKRARQSLFLSIWKEGMSKLPHPIQQAMVRDTKANLEEAAAGAKFGVDGPLCGFCKNSKRRRIDEIGPLF